MATNVEAEFFVGDLVRLVGLQREEFNHHVGRVIQPRGENGRVGVSLHSAIWDHRGARAGERRCRGAGKASSCDIQVKVANVRRVELPGTEPAVITSIGTIPAGFVSRLLGEKGWGLPDNIMAQVIEYLRVLRVAESDVSVAGCSSSRGDFPLNVVLAPREDQWWISAADSMPDGTGNEYLEFSFGRIPRRVSFVALKIPSLPYGPLSVRDFHVTALLCDVHTSHPNAWTDVMPALQTLDQDDLQEFALVPPVETTALRLVCTSNAARNGSATCVGLFQVCFA